MELRPNILKPADLFYFMGKCLAMDHRPETVSEVKSLIRSELIPWERFVWISSSNLVTPALYSSFKRNGIVPLLPPDLADHLSYIYELTLSRNRKMARQATGIHNLLAKNGINAVFLKGTGHLFGDLYHDWGERVTGDIDLLVGRSDMERSVELLLCDGYSISDPETDPDLFDHHHYPGIWKEGEPAMVELHYEPVYERYSRLIRADEIFAGKVRCDQYGVFVPSLHHQRIINFVHSQLVNRGLYYGLPSMKDMYDFYLLSVKELPGNQSELLFFNNRFKVYKSLVSAVFYDPASPPHRNSFRAKVFMFRHRLLLSSRLLQLMNRFLLMNLVRSGIYAGLFLRYPFSRKARYDLKNRVKRNVLHADKTKSA